MYISRDFFDKKSLVLVGLEGIGILYNKINVLSLFFGFMTLDFLSNRTKNDSLVAENESICCRSLREIIMRPFRHMVRSR